MHVIFNVKEKKEQKVETNCCHLLLSFFVAHLLFSLSRCHSGRGNNPNDKKKDEKKDKEKVSW